MKLVLLFSSALFLSQLVFPQTGVSGFEQEYVKKNLIKKVKTTYEYYETDTKGKAKKKDRREGKAIYTFDDDGRIITAEFFYQDGSPSNRDEYTYDNAGVMQSVKKSRVMGNYIQTKLERVFAYDFHYTGNGDMDYCDLTIYDVQAGKKGQGTKKKLQDIKIFYPFCFDSTKAEEYQRDNKGLIKSIELDKEHTQTFDYEFF